MRRLFLFIITCVWMSVSATNTLSLSTLSGHPRETLTVSVALANNEPVTALQADIPLNANLVYVANSATLNASRSNGHSIVAAASKDTLHIAVFSLTQAALTGTEGELLTFQVTLGIEPATYTLTATTVMSGTSGQVLDASVKAGSLTLLSPKIKVITTSLDYGHIPIRANYTQTLQVGNVGNEPLHISGVLFSAPEFSVPQTAYTIAAGQTQNIVITFAPTVHGAISERVRLRSDAINDPDVYGANVCQLIADPFSVNELRLQSASGISDEEVTVVVRMNNMESIVGVQFSLELPSALEFVAGSETTLERASGHSVLSTMSNDTLTLLLYHPQNEPVTGDDGDLLSFRVRLNGTSGGYTLQPINTMLVNAAHNNMVSAVYDADITIQSPTISADNTLAFGHVTVNEVHSTSYAISNTGQAPLIVERITFLSEGLRVTTRLPIEIAPNATQNVEVEFTPWQEGAFSTIIQVYSNDPTCRMKSVSVTADMYESNSFTFRGEVMPQDSSYHLYVDLTNYSDIAGVQFDVEGLTPWTSYNLSERSNGHQVVIQPIDETHHRVIIYAVDNAILAGHEGMILEWIWETSLAKALNGNSVSMSNAILVNPSKGNREVEPAPPFEVSLSDDLKGIDDINATTKSQKIVRDNQVLILRGDKTYTVMGQEIK